MRKIDMKTGIKGFGRGFVEAGVLGVLFYKSVVIMLLFGGLFGIYSVFLEKKREEKRKQQEITLEFREGLQGISSALSAGYSIENAFREARKDLRLLYGKESVLAEEFLWIEKQLQLNRGMEECLFAFAEKWDVEDITHFAQVFQTAKKTGGDLIAITHSTAEKISQKIEVQREIQTMIAGKKLEGKIMNYIPLGMILYFWLCSPGFLDCFYIGTGRVISTILLIFYIVAYLWNGKICDIKI